MLYSNLVNEIKRLEKGNAELRRQLAERDERLKFIYEIAEGEADSDDPLEDIANIANVDSPAYANLKAGLDRLADPVLKLAQAAKG